MQWPKQLHPRTRISMVSQETHIFPPTSFEELLCCAHLVGMRPMEVNVMLASTVLKSLVYNHKVHF